MASVSFRNSEPNRVSLKTSQNETHRGQFGHFALTIYKHFALHKSKEDSDNFNSPILHKHILSILSQFSQIKTTNYIKLSSILIKFHQDQEYGLKNQDRSSDFSSSLLIRSRDLSLSHSGFAFVIESRSCRVRVHIVFAFVLRLDLHSVSLEPLN